MPNVRKPEWLRIGKVQREEIRQVQKLMRELHLHTVCEESMCPNIGKCFVNKTATFLVMGNVCTRNCKFCDIATGRPQPLDPMEPKHIVEAAKKLNLEHVVVTSVTRDDLTDGGAAHFAEITRKLREYKEDLIIELLIPDMKGKVESIKTIIEAKPNIINHNVEVVPRLYKKVTPQANYEISLKVLKMVKEYSKKILTKSGIMVGLGETKEEVIQVLKDLRKVDCDILTIGQYLKPPSSNLEIEEYVHPDTFKEYEKIGYELGFKFVASAPFVRSSFNAKEADFLLATEV
ncbi:MAG: lipoyl synthase [Candidatus Heimdallarchaeum endolithica]|uniref:Lipoyl synthase n=1 Tax=Candidatus Heimdallarchaeum endolithica TaxID=2876572 RepID=A0A9Y1FN72_9ARCH|nr:MAG: lipoyl synthase [Candidatus Heimdallarchaeum endolithica]